MDYTKQKKIFIVDDDVMLTESLSDYLTRTVAHKVSVFPTGEDCLKHLDESPDIVILDYFLNTVQEDAANGMEILQTIKRNYPKTHVIMLSSQERYAVAMQTIQKGAEQYVVKDKDAFRKIADMLNSF